MRESTPFKKCFQNVYMHKIKNKTNRNGFNRFVKFHLSHSVFPTAERLMKTDTRLNTNQSIHLTTFRDLALAPVGSAAVAPCCFSFLLSFFWSFSFWTELDVAPVVDFFSTTAYSVLCSSAKQDYK